MMMQSGASHTMLTDHTDTYKNGYQDGYRAGIHSTIPSSDSGQTANVPPPYDVHHSGDTSVTTSKKVAGELTAGQSVGDINVHGSNNKIQITQTQAQSQNLNSPTIHDPRTHFYTPEEKQAIENALIP